MKESNFMNKHGFGKDGSSERNATEKDLVFQMPFDQGGDLSIASPLLLNLRNRLGLRASRNPRSLQALLQDLFSEAWQVRVEAVHGLELLDEIIPQRALLIALEDENAFVRAAAARAIGNIGVVEMGKHLTDASYDEEKYVRAAAVQALGKLPLKIEKKVLIDRLSDPESIVRIAAIVAIGKKADITLLPLLEQLIDREDDEMARMEAIDIYQRLISDSAKSSILEKCFKDVEDYHTDDGDLAQRETLKIRALSNPTRKSEIVPSENRGISYANTSCWCPCCVSYPDSALSWINQLDVYSDRCFLRGPEPLDDPVLIDLLVKSLYKVFENRKRVLMSQSSIEQDTAVVFSSSYPDEADAIDERLSIEEIVRQARKITTSVAPLCSALNETDRAVRKVAEDLQRELDVQPWTEVLLIAGEMQSSAYPRRLSLSAASKKVIFCSISYLAEGKKIEKMINAPILEELLNGYHMQERQRSDDRFSPRLSQVKIWYGTAARSLEV